MSHSIYSIENLKLFCKYLNTACLIMSYRNELKYEYANDCYYKLFKYHPDDDFNYAALFSNDNQKITNKIEQAILNNEKSLEIKFQTFTKDNELIWLLLKYSFIYTEEFIAIICLAENITETKENQPKYLHDSLLNIGLTSDTIAFYAIDVDNDLIIEDFISSTNKMKRYGNLETDSSYSEFLLSWSEVFIHPDDKNKFFNDLNPYHLKELFNQRITEICCEYRSLLSNQKYIWTSSTIHLSYNEETDKIIGFVYIKNINDKKELALLKQTALPTKLYNHSALKQIIGNYLNNKATKSGALLLINIDNFKNINDNLNHLFGDRVLRDVTDKLTSIFDKEAIIGRYSDNEFIVFVKDISSKEYIYAKTNLILKELNLSYSSGLNEYAISSSIGIVFIPEDGNTLADLFARADLAVYRAKKLGKSQYYTFNEHNYEITPYTNYISKGWLIDELDEIVYVSSIDNYELLFMNRNGRELTGINVGDYKHIKCYEALHGRSSPCPFCSNAKLTLNDFYTWEMENHFLNKKYVVKDKLIMIDDKLARMGIAHDVTTTHNSSLEQVPIEFAIEKTILSCMKILANPDTLDKAITNVLKIIGNFYQATRAFIIEINLDTKTGKNTYEWCKDGYPHYREQLQNIDFTQLPYIYETYEHNSNLIINDCETMKDDYPREYKYFKNRGAQSIVIIPYEEKGVFAGYIGVDNPSVNRNTITLLDSIIFSIINEIKKRRLAEQNQYSLYHDDLSGLYNRNSFSNFLNIGNNAERCQAIVLADINGLKEINRDFGHAYGDNIITILSEIMLSYFDKQKLFRLSGDEFIIVVNDIEYDHFIKTVKQMEDELHVSTPNGVSIGYAWSEDDVEITDLILQAEELMIINKQAYYERANEYKKHYSPKKLEKLLTAFKQKQFIVYLQPKLDINKNKVVSAESLVRLNIPGRGLIMPNKFIPVIEKEHLTKHMDFYMFEEVCKILDSWQKQGKELIPISVNISRLTLLEMDFISSLKEVKDKFDFPNEYIILEITESIGNFDRSIITSIAKQIKDLGFKISLDDFGAQYANLSLLATLEFDELKVDKSIIDILVDNDNCKAILQYISDLCKKINITCIAEGVENKTQFDILLNLGVNIIQGYYYSKPLPLNIFEQKMIV